MRRYGQHFLKDESVARNFIELLNLESGQSVVEIGPGRGSLTKILLEKGCKVLAFEIDPLLVEELQANIKAPLLKVRQCDFLLVEKDELGDINLCVGSIPYQNSLEIIMKICQLGFESVALIVQKEFAQKISAKPGDKRYTFISALVQSIYHVEIAFSISRIAFTPLPKVTSSAILLRRIRNVDSFDDYSAFLRHLFRSPNKLVKNAIEEHTPFDQQLLNRRVRQLSAEELLYLYGKWWYGKTRSFGNGT